MKAFFIAMIGGQMFAVDKDWIVGVGLRDEEKVKPLEDEGRKFLPLANQETALICDLLPHVAGQETSARCNYYLIIRYQGLYMALPMRGKGRIVFVDEMAVQPLPPAFTGLARALVPSVLINCSDLLLLLDLNTLAEVSDASTDGRFNAVGLQ